MDPGPILVVSGPSCVGKSTVGRAMAEAFPASALLHGDDFMHAIVRGWVEPWLPESAHQNEVVGAAFAVAAMAFATGGYLAVIDGHLFPDGVDGLAAACRARKLELHYAVLRADLDTCRDRADERGDGAGLHPGFGDLHARYGDLGVYEAHAVDASGDPDDVVAAVLSAFESGRLATNPG